MGQVLLGDHSVGTYDGVELFLDLTEDAWMFDYFGHSPFVGHGGSVRGCGYHILSFQFPAITRPTLKTNQNKIHNEKIHEGKEEGKKLDIYIN